MSNKPAEADRAARALALKYANETRPSLSWRLQLAIGYSIFQGLFGVAAVVVLIAVMAGGSPQSKQLLEQMQWWTPVLILARVLVPLTSAWLLYRRERSGAVLAGVWLGIALVNEVVRGSQMRGGTVAMLVTGLALLVLIWQELKKQR